MMALEDDDLKPLWEQISSILKSCWRDSYCITKNPALKKAPMKLTKSTRHSKITGDFGESIVLYLLSRHGFECAKVDHTGIDLIARRPNSREVLGISVKSRSRQAGTENTHLALNHEGFEKAKTACDAFGCIPYFALVIDAGEKIRVFLLSLRHLKKICPGGSKVSAWQMSESFQRKYYSDPHIKIFEFSAHGQKWF